MTRRTGTGTGRWLVAAIAVIVLSEVLTAAVGAAPGAQAPGGSVELVLIGEPGVPSARLASRLVGVTGSAGIDIVPESADGVAARKVSVAAGDVERVGAVLGVDPTVRAVEPVRTYRAALVPNDPGWPEQDELSSLGMPAAWDVSTGSSSVVIAVVDTGVNAVGDLTGKVLPGYNVIAPASPPADDNGHGTEVASIAASTGNDNASIAGMCWSCRILPVKALDSEGNGSSVDVANGIRWATDHGANIVNLSLGGPEYSQYMADAVAYARARGAVVVAAAGNQGPDGGPDYPAAVPGTISVAGARSTTLLYDGSNRGADWVDVAAPGCTESGPTGFLPFCGTSAATPIVAGLAALVRSVAPTMSEGGVRNLIQTASTPMVDVRYGLIAPAATMSTAAAAPDTQPPERTTPLDRLAPVSWLDPLPTWVRGTRTLVVRGYDDHSLDRAWVTASVGVDGVPVQIGSPMALSGTADEGTVSWDTTAWPDGPVILTVRVADTVGHVSSSSLATNVDNTAPVPILSAPSVGSVVIGSFWMGAGARDNGDFATLIVRDGAIVGGFSGPGPVLQPVLVGRTGPVDLALVSVDVAGNVAMTGTSVWAVLPPPPPPPPPPKPRVRRRRSRR